MYYAAVRAFGREDPEAARATSTEAQKEYEARLIAYKASIAQAYVDGELPAKK